MKGKTKYTLILWMVLLALVVTACAENNDGADVDAPEAEVAAVEPTDVPVEPTAPSASSGQAVPTEPPTEPTDASAEPIVEATDASAGSEQAVPVVEEAAPKRFGILRFRDNNAATAGSFQLLMEGIAPPPAGTQYVLWLIDNSFNTLNLGPFAVTDGNVQYTGDTGQNLLGTYNDAFISIEPDGVTDGEIGTIAFDGTVPAGSLLHIRHVVTAFPANPDGKAFLIGAQGELQQAMEHTGFMLDELANDNIREAQRHAEHIVNILDGEGGANFGDLDGDSVAQNPGDGVGVRGHLEGARQHTNLATDAEDVTIEVALHAEHVLISSDNALGRIDAAIAEALRVIASDTTAEAQPAAEKLAGLLETAMNGVDANGDGAIAPIPDEGGVLTAYVHGQNMGSFEFFAAEGVAVAAAPAAAEAAPAEDEAVAEVEAPTEEAPPAAAPVPVTIEMANFAYVSNDVTVSVGTAVTWVNKDSGPRHSATAADGSFDTGLLDSGQEATIIFDTPGTYLYYCTLHGSPDGSGMVATIIVTE